MAELNWDSILIGIRILLGSQLIIISLIHFFNNKKLSKWPLAIICFIVGFWFFWRFTVPYQSSSVLLRIFVNAGKEVFVPVLVYFVLKQSLKTLDRKTIIAHLIFPSVFFITYVILTLFLDDKINDRKLVYNSLTILPTLLVSVIYFFLGLKELRKAKIRLVRKAYLKYKIFFYTLIFCYFEIAVTSANYYYVFIRIFIPKYSMPNGEFNEHTESFLINSLSKFFNGPYSIYAYFSNSMMFFVGFILFLFALSELPFLKKSFLPIKILYDDSILESDAKDRITSFFGNSELISNKSLSIADCCNQISCTRKELIDYLKVYKKTTFNDYLNTLRIELFKNKLLDQSNNIYDITSLSDMVGFKSRATFYRVFKEKEGITPTQYKNELSRK